jgi:sulfonate transport system substrate-binding protein
MSQLLTLLSLLFICILPNYLTSAVLRIASDTVTIEHTPGRIAIDDYYKGEAEIVGGGIAALLSDPTVDLGTNAEIPSLRNYATNRNLRIIHTVTETYYRIVASKKLGIKTLKDLDGKTIGSIPGTTAAYFAQKFLATVGVTNFTVVYGQLCMKAPCGPGTLPYMIADGTIQAISLWEPTPELAVQALGADAIVFQDRSLYREIVNLQSTAEKLANPEKRKEIVEFIKALIKAQEVFRTKPESLYERVATVVGSDTGVIKAVWPIHGWRGTLVPDLYERLLEEEPWTAQANNRATLSKDDLAKLIDRSVLEEALKA